MACPVVNVVSIVSIFAIINFSKTSSIWVGVGVSYNRFCRLITMSGAYRGRIFARTCR